MEGFTVSFMPLLRRFAPEILLLSAAFILTVCSISVYLYANNNTENDIASLTPVTEHAGSITGTIMVEVSGALQRPGVYSFPYGSRLQEAVKKAGGLSEDADPVYFSRYFNQSRFLTDQEKIYIPSREEIADGTVPSPRLILDYTTPQTITSIYEQTRTQNVISINTATTEDLDGLPGIGQATASKIVQNRPYTTPEELITKKILKQNVFDQVKNLISL